MTITGSAARVLGLLGGLAVLAVLPAACGTGPDGFRRVGDAPITDSSGPPPDANSQADVGLGGDARSARGCGPTAAGRLGLPRQAHGVWDRFGLQPVANYPFLRGQGYTELWAQINPAKGVFDWTALDQQLQVASSQGQYFSIQISPIGGAKGSSVPPWLFGAGIPKTSDGTYVYGFYLDPNYRLYFSEMVKALAHHVRHELAPQLRERVSFVRCDTGATGDEAPYEEPSAIPKAYQISATEWQAFRLWAFEVYRQSFQDGEGPVIPLLFQDIENTSYPVEWDWVRTHVLGGFGAKYGGQVRGHHLTESQQVTDAFKLHAVDSDLPLFSRNEMDQTWSKPYFQLNIRLGMYWAAVEQLHAGLAVWDVTQSCLDNAYADDFAFVFDFFNKWAASLDPLTADGGFSILHEGLDAADTVKFPESVFGKPAKLGNAARYQNICAARAKQGAQMDDLHAATKGQVVQRDSQKGFNDAGWKIVAGNYERFITQLNPESTSKGLWRVNGPLTAASHPYDRFARSFDHATGKDAMSFAVHSKLLPQPGQPVQLSVDYLDRGTGQFALQYDAVGDSQRIAFVVTKTNTNTWKTQSIVVSDWAFMKRAKGGADLVLVNTDADDDVFHAIEIRKQPVPCAP